MRRLSLVGVMLLPLTACNLAPEYALPEAPAAATFKEDISTQTVDVAPASDGKWKRFDEKAQIEEFAWWRMFEDAKLDALMEQAMKDNPTLDVAINRVVAARSVASTRAAELYPSVDVGFGPERTRQSPAAQEPNLPPNTPANVKPYTLYSARGTIAYDLDLFGQNRGRTRAAENDADAEQSNYRAARLGLQAEIVQTYFRVAALRSELAMLMQTLATREKSLELTRKKSDVGAADVLVYSASEADLAAIKSETAGIAQSLAVAEHSLATLLGIAPSQLTLETANLDKAPPVVPAGLPSRLLERRPDIKQAERQIAAANERIGVARGGYFPDISLSVVGGFVAGDLSDLFTWSNRTWTIGPLAGTMLTQPIFEGGKLAAAKAQTRADFEGAVANYKASVLTAFREVEDQLSAVRYVGEQVNATQAGLDAATRAHKAANARFKVGYSSHLEFLDAERSLLAAKRSMIQLRGNQYISTVQLVKALGGSWDAPAAPEPTGELTTPN
jgi:multidrug efflux system outer membrane protein